MSGYQKKRFMINRVLIRLKVVQIVYAYYKNSGKSLKAAEDEMFFSLSKAYDLYHYLLLLMPGITNYAADRISFLSRKVRPTESDKNPNLKFVNNRFIAQLGQIEQLVKFAEKSKLNWVDHSDFLRRLLDNIEASDIYKEYMESGVDSYEEDKEVWRKLYKAFVSLAMSSVSKWCIIPIQDYLGLDNDCRINQPSTMGCNWRWRITQEQLSDELQQELLTLAKRYGRMNWANEPQEDEGVKANEE